MSADLKPSSDLFPTAGLSVSFPSNHDDDLTQIGAS